MLALTPDVFAK